MPKTPKTSYPSFLCLFTTQNFILLRLNISNISGVGGVGTCFLSQLVHISTTHPNLSLIFIARSSKCLYTKTYDTSISLNDWSSALAASTTPAPPSLEILSYLSSVPGKCILVDNTSNEDVAKAYPAFLQSGVSVVTPNKKAFSGSLQLWQDIFDTTSSAPGKPPRGLIYHEASVGAGLPVISTLHDLINTGDEILKIEGVFSGTMSFLFNNFSPSSGSSSTKWSQEVHRARENGFTEPDPRDDLNGMDVARKLVILARIAGLPIESTASFPVQSLIPKELQGAATGEEFLARLGEFDGDMEAVKSEAEQEGKVVRFVGSVDVRAQQARVGIERFGRAHPIAALKGSDNIIAFHTKRYSNSPLIVQGAG